MKVTWAIDTIRVISLNTLDDVKIEVEIRAIENTEFGVGRSPSLSCNNFNAQRDFEFFENDALFVLRCEIQ